MKKLYKSDVACGVEIPGIPSMAAVLLMRDGTWRYDSTLAPADRVRAERWVRDVGPAWIAGYRDELSKWGLLDGGEAR
ncbi:hypothetical protein [Gordonia sputi]